MRSVLTSTSTERLEVSAQGRTDSLSYPFDDDDGFSLEELPIDCCGLDSAEAVDELVEEIGRLDGAVAPARWAGR